MPEIIRRIEDRDFEKVASLYKYRKTVVELKWLFTDPDDPNTYNAFVVIKDDFLVGVIGNSLSTYTDGNQNVTGVIPISWKVADDYKGFAGVQLFKKVLSLGEFGIAIAGSEKAQQLYPLFKYRFLSNSFEYFKLLNPKNALQSLKRKTPIKTFGMVAYLIPTYLKRPTQNQYTKDIELIPYGSDQFMDEPMHKGVFRKKMTKNYVHWLLSCPELESYAFCVTLKKQYLGICILYIQKVNGVNRGRIVHLPYLGSDPDLWVAVIDACIQFFKDKQCCLVTGLAHHAINRQGFLSSRFSTFRGAGKPVFVKDPLDKLTTLNLENWFLQFSEGDKAYRDL